MDHSILWDVSLDETNTIIHQSILKYLEKRRKSIDEPIINKLVLNLPFIAEPETSAEVLGAGFSCNTMIGPDKEPKNAFKSLVLTFKKKSSSYSARKKVQIKKSDKKDVAFGIAWTEERRKKRTLDNVGERTSSA